MLPVEMIGDPCDDFPTLSESGEFGLPDSTEVVVVSEVGSYSCCDVWVHVPTAWVPRVSVLIYGRVGRARVLIGGARLEKLPLTSAGGFESAIAASLRGRPVRSFEVACVASAGAPLANGRVALQAWSDRAALGGTSSVDAPLVHARLMGRDSVSGAATEVTVSATGHLRVRGAGT